MVSFSCNMHYPGVDWIDLKMQSGWVISPRVFRCSGLSVNVICVALEVKLDSFLDIHLFSEK